MKKLIVISALMGLVAAGCASRENQGGTSSSQNTPNYGTGTSDMGTSGTSNTQNSDLQKNTQGKGANDLQNNNNSGAGAATAPGGTSSGTSSEGVQTPKDNSNAQGTDTNSIPQSQDNNNTTPNSGTSGSGQP